METEHEDEWELIDDVDADWEKVTSEADAKTARMKTFAEALAQPSAAPSQSLASAMSAKQQALRRREASAMAAKQQALRFRGPPSPTRSRRDRLTGSERLPRWSDVAFVSQ